MKVGIDVTQVGRLRALLTRYPQAEERFFTETERRHCRAHADPVVHLAGTFAAKEAVVKAVGLGPIWAWARRIEIRRDPRGSPRASIAGRALELVVSISHEADVAIAMAIDPNGSISARSAPSLVENSEGPGGRQTTNGSRSRPRANGNLQTFLAPAVEIRQSSATPGERLTVLENSLCGSDFP